jgi:hypothetical protein
VSRKLITAAVALASAATGIAIVGCGTAKTSGAGGGQVVRAADITSRAPGYRMSGTIDLTGASAVIHGTMSGAFDSAHHTGAFTMQETLAGHPISMAERLSGTTVYMSMPGVPGIERLTGGKPWIKLDFTRALGAIGLGLPSQSANPAQFIDYLRSVGAQTKQVGTATIDGTQTTHYHVVVNLDNYPKLFPPARRAAAARGVSTMESVIGSHTMPMEVWIGSDKLLRRMSFSFGECVQSQHLTMGMTMDMSHYGPQTVPAPPSPAQAYDLTPLVLKSLGSLKASTCGPTA